MMRVIVLFVLLLSGMPVAWSAVSPASINNTLSILVVGDSISAAYGIRPGQGWVALLDKRLKQSGYDYRVVNASISGDTTQNGVYRMAAALDKHKPRMVIIELGGNDGLRGLSLQQMRNNLARMIEMAQQRRVQVVLAGIRIPPNYGKLYTEAFYRVYEELARRYNIAFVPFLLDSVGGHDQLMQADGIHPGEAAQGIILDNVWRVIKPRL